MTYPEVNANKHTVIVVNHPWMSSVGTGMVSQFVLHYMHSLCLGVTRRLISLWLSGTMTDIFRLRARTVNKTSDHLMRTEYTTDKTTDNDSI